MIGNKLKRGVCSIQTIKHENFIDSLLTENPQKMGLKIRQLEKLAYKKRNAIFNANYLGFAASIF